MAKKCVNKISSRCLTKINARCVDYEGTLSIESKLDIDDCLNIQEVIEDINEQLDDINEQLDVSDFGCCLEYTPAGDKLEIKDILKEHESQICDILTILEEDKKPCGSCEDECGNPTDNCCGGLVFKSYAGGEIFIGVDYVDWSAPAPYPTTNYTATRSGTYKYTIDLMCGDEDPDAEFIVGLSINGFDPANNQFEQFAVVPRGELNNRTVHLITELKKTDIVKVKFKQKSDVAIVDNIKVVIEKV